MTPDTEAPHDQKSERIILCALLREPALAWRAVDAHAVTQEAFYYHSHRVLFGVLKGLRKFKPKYPLAEAHEAILLAGLAREFPDRPSLFLVGLLDNDPTGAWVDHACGKVHRDHARRLVIHRAKEALRDAYDGVHGADEYTELNSQLPQVKREGDSRGSKPPRGRRR